MTEHEFIKAQLQMCMSDGLKVNYVKLSVALIQIKKKLQRMNEKKEDKVLTYSYLVDLMMPENFRGCKRRFTRLLKALSKHGFVITENRSGIDNIVDIGPRLHSHQSILDSAPLLAKALGYEGEQTQSVILYTLAPYRVILGGRHRQQINISHSLVSDVLIKLHDKESKEAMLSAKKWIRILVSKGHLRVSEKKGRGHAVSMEATESFCEILKEVNAVITRQKNFRTQEGI